MVVAGYSFSLSFNKYSFNQCTAANRGRITFSKKLPNGSLKPTAVGGVFMSVLYIIFLPRDLSVRTSLIGKISFSLIILSPLELTSKNWTFYR